MNWQTKEVQNWLNKVGILNSQREDAAKLESLVENLLLEEFDGSATNILKRQITLYFLGKVQWEELVINPDAWDDYEYEEDVN